MKRYACRSDGVRGPGGSLDASLVGRAAHRDQFVIVFYAAAFDPASVKPAAKSVHYGYLTNDDLPNPWDTLSSYFDALLGAIAA